MAGDESSARERNRLSARRRIEEAALDLFTKQGFEATTVDEIAAAANVARASVFRYFGAKDELVFEIEGPMLENLLGLLRQRPARPLGEILVSYAAYLDSIASDVFVRAAVIARTPRLLSRFSLTRTAWDAAVASELAARERGPDAVPTFEDGVRAALAVTALFIPFQVWGTSSGVRLQDLVERAIAVAGGPFV
jgi:AcrR family transcriptional regulator